MELYCTPKSQYTTDKHSRQLFEHTYTSDQYGPGTLSPIKFFQQDLLWQSSNTHSNSCSLKLPNTSRDNPSSGYRFSCTPQRHFGVYSIVNLHWPRWSNVFIVHGINSRVPLTQFPRHNCTRLFRALQAVSHNCPRTILKPHWTSVEFRNAIVTCV
jgi:hypothetical protein